MRSLEVCRDLHPDLAACALLPTPLGLEVEFPLHQHCEVAPRADHRCKDESNK